MTARKCALPGCDATTDHISGYCTDACLQADMDDDDLPPVTVVSPNKSGGFGRGLHWAVRQPVRLPKRMR